MKQFGWVKTLILSVVTCGIYSWYFWIKSTSDKNKVAEKYEVPTIKSFIVAFLLGCVTLGIYQIVWMFKYFKQTILIAEKKNVDLPIKNAFLAFILSFVPVYSWYLVCTMHNRIVEGEAE